VLLMFLPHNNHLFWNHLDYIAWISL